MVIITDFITVIHMVNIIIPPPLPLLRVHPALLSILIIVIITQVTVTFVS